MEFSIVKLGLGSQVNTIRTIFRWLFVFLSWIFSIKTMTWLILCMVVFSSLFKINGAELSNNVVATLLMLLLLTLFSDLKEFNFWGLWGKKDKEKELQDLKGGQAVENRDTKNIPDEVALNSAERKQISLMDPTKGNFLALAFEVERLLRIFANINLGKDVGSFVSDQIIDELHSEKLLTDLGVKQVNAVRWLRNEFIHAQDHNVTPQTLNNGIAVAYSLQNELYNWLYPG